MILQRDSATAPTSQIQRDSANSAAHNQNVPVALEKCSLHPTARQRPLGKPQRHSTTARQHDSIQHCGLEFPRTRVVVNLAPADLPKRGTAFDLPIAVGMLLADAAKPIIASMIGQTLKAVDAVISAAPAGELPLLETADQDPSIRYEYVGPDNRRTTRGE